MTLLIQAMPLLALVAMLASGRTGAPVACVVAMGLTLPAALTRLGSATELPGFVGRAMAEGAWLAVVPVGIILGGLLFHAAAGDRAADAKGVTSGGGRTGSVADTLFTSAFLLGPFAETVTGFGVGTVFAISAIRRAGIAGAGAASIGLMAQLLIPWGGLGPGTAIGAALAGVPAQQIAARNAVLLAAELVFILPLFWHWCARVGHPVAARGKAAQAAWVALTAALLIAAHAVVPWEVCGLLAAGSVLTVKLLAGNPPHGRDGWARALLAAAPYLLLTAVLLGSRLWRGAPALRPLDGLPALPLNHAMVALWLVALTLLLLRPAARLAVRPALLRARRPAVALLSFVLLARFLTNAGVPQALATALAGAFGSAAPFAAPLLAGIAGFFAGTNVGSNSAMMPLQAALGRVAGLDPVVLPAVQNGTLFMVLSPQLTAIASGLAGDGASPRGIWRMAWPIFPIALGVGLVAVAVG